MKSSTLSTTGLAAAACLAFTSSPSLAVEIFSATTENTTAVVNGTNPLPTISGATPDLLVTNNADTNNLMSGFASTDDINTLNGTALTAADTVTISMTVDSITGAIMRSNGLEFGLADTVAFRGGSASNLLLGMAGSNNGSDVRITASFQDDGTLDFNSNQAAIEDGFTITLTANNAGYSFVVSDILVAGSTNPSFVDGETTATISGAFSGTEFLDNFGTGHFYAAVQQFGGTMITDYSSATIDVTVILDTDGDLIPDDYEDANGLDRDDPADAAQGANDGLFDNDGLTNLEEFLGGTDPNLADTDGDLLNDGDEVNGTSNPFQVDHIAGTSPAGAPGEGTDPLVPDTDRDGLNDFEELDNANGSVTNPNSDDTDGDSFTDLFEIEAGTVPDDAASFPVFPSISWSAQEFNAESNLSTEGDLLFADNLQGADVTVNGIPFTGRTTSNGSDFSTPNLQTELGSTGLGINNIYDNEVPALTPLLADFWFVSDPERINFTLTGLTPGETYLVEFGHADDRTGAIIDRYRQVDSFGGGVTSDPIGETNLTYGGPDNPAILLTGRFTAAFTAQPFSFSVNDVNQVLLGSQLAFIQVRSGVSLSGPQPLQITNIERNGDEVTLTWNSNGSGQFNVFYSLDLIDWDESLELNVLADPGSSTSRTYNLTNFGSIQNEPKVFFRVEE